MSSRTRLGPYQITAAISTGGQTLLFDEEGIYGGRNYAVRSYAYPDGRALGDLYLAEGLK